MITSIKNQQVKNVMLLNTKAKARKEQKLFVVEGLKMYLEAPKDRLYKVFMSQSFYEKHKDLYSEENEDMEIVEDDIFIKMSDTQTPQGILCIVRQKESDLNDFLSNKNAHLILLENLQDPGNLGTIMRTGEGAGVTGVILSRNSVDIYNPKVIRATMGSIYRVPFLYVDDLIDTIALLKQNEITVYASHLAGKHNYDEITYQKSCGFLIGNEGNGLSEEVAQCADEYIRIPMLGKVESLNAAVATAILVYEVFRQRRQ